MYAIGNFLLSFGQGFQFFFILARDKDQGKQYKIDKFFHGLIEFC